MTAAAIAPDGARVALGYADRSVRLWDAGTGAILATLPNDDPDDRGGVASVFFTRDGARVLVGFGAGSSLLCDARDLTPLFHLEGRSASATDSPFSEDGRLAVTVSGDGGVMVSDLVEGAGVVLEGHAALVLSARFDGGDRHLVTASVDGTIRLWDLLRQESTVVLGSPGQGAATFAHLRGGEVVAAYASGALRVHPVDPRSALGRACEALAYFGRAAGAEAPFCPSSGVTEKSRNTIRNG